MISPNFLIVGAQKCGTTTLFDILNEHPEVNMSKIKEINFFTSSKKYNKGLEHYSNYFNEPKFMNKITGEASPGYMNTPGIAKKIFDNLGDIKNYYVIA